jgi:hypothetical protein
METSALTGGGIGEMFDALAKAMFREGGKLASESVKLEPVAKGLRIESKENCC